MFAKGDRIRTTREAAGLPAGLEGRITAAGPWKRNPEYITVQFENGAYRQISRRSGADWNPTWFEKIN